MAVVVILVASCSTSNEVVFDGTPTPPPSGTPLTTAGAAGSSTTAEEPGPVTTVTPSTTSTGIEDDAPAAENRLPTPPTLALSQRSAGDLPGQIVVNDIRTSSVTILGPRLGQIDPFAAPGENLQQPTWAPDGDHVAWTRTRDDGFSVVVGSSKGGRAREFTTPFGVFYMQWRPDSGAIALLGSPEPAQVGLAILDLETETVTPLNSSSSYYLHWSPEGNELIIHLGSARLERLDPLTGDTSLFESLDPVNSVFQAASWTPDGGGILYVRPASADSTEGQDELILRDIETGDIKVLTEGVGFFSFAASPDGKAIAYSIRNMEGVTSMGIVEVGSGRRQEIEAPSTLAWQWSPDSRKILLLGLGDRAMSVSVYESGKITHYQEIIPTTTFLQNYLFFWSQYDLSHSLWAPDSSAFVFPAVDGAADAVFLQYLDDDLPVLLGPGSVAVFSPTPPDL